MVCQPRSQLVTGLCGVCRTRAGQRRQPRVRVWLTSAEWDTVTAACETITDEEYELAIVRALRPLAEQRRDAAARSL